MQAEVDLHPEIANFTALDAGASDDKQISDIQQLVGGGCHVLIVSPNTTATLTPAVEAACGQLPVVVFDRGVDTDCPVTFIHPIGGYAFGATAAEFLSDEVGQGGKVLALRVLPGVDVLEHRWAAAERIFAARGVDVVGVEFTENDPATAKSIVSDYLQREGEIGGIWMDDGTAAVAVLEAFEDTGQPAPAISGEDQQQFLEKWQAEGLTAQAPTYPTFQWRTAVIAALQIVQGQQVPSEWILPQPTITDANLSQYLQPGLPPLHYALCGCQQMPGFPQRWGGGQ
jgi:ribose transport system substrate-binding protein